uniref:Uncharacterized protein n=1 Tax=Leersia perrieri TaxID=77586 RepID=A0A0D9V8A6_9ORYZ
MSGGLARGRGDPFFYLTLFPSSPTTWMDWGTPEVVEHSLDGRSTVRRRGGHCALKASDDGGS